MSGRSRNTATFLTSALALAAAVPSDVRTKQYMLHADFPRLAARFHAGQAAMLANIDAATARVLDAAGIQSVVAPSATCCGAVKFHLNDHDGGMHQMRTNIDAWWPYVEGQGGQDGAPKVEAILMNASGCGVMVKDYGHVLRDDPLYADKARRISALTRDLSEWLPELTQALQGKLKPGTAAAAFHPPCTLQHGQQLKGGVELHLAKLGFVVKPILNEAHLCCGSAGTYSVLQPDIAYELRDRKLGHLKETQAQVILSANIGCITQLARGSDAPVVHTVELIDWAQGGPLPPALEGAGFPH